MLTDNNLDQEEIELDDQSIKNEIGQKFIYILEVLGWSCKIDHFGNLICRLPEEFISNKDNWNITSDYFEDMLPFLKNNLFHSSGRIDSEDGYVYLSKLSDFGSIFGVNSTIQRDIIIFKKDCSDQVKFDSIYMAGFMFPGSGISDFTFMIN